LLGDKGPLTPVESYTVARVDTSVHERKARIQLNSALAQDPQAQCLTTITRRPTEDILNSTVRSYSATAYRIMTDSVYIARNTIQQSSGTAIQLGAERSWRESGPVAHIVVEKNWIVDCGYGHGIQKGSAINVDVSGVDGKPPLLNTDIIIQNNVIQTQGQMAI